MHQLIVFTHEDLNNLSRILIDNDIDYHVEKTIHGNLLVSWGDSEGEEEDAD